MNQSEQQQVRAFVAIPLEHETKAKLRKIQQHVGQQLPAGAVRWVQAELLHLTMRFLGNVASDQISNLEAALRNAAGDAAPLQLRVEKTGCFPDAKRPRVIWVGLEGDLEPLAKLQAKIGQTLIGYGDHAEDKPFKPHLTIGRVKTNDPKTLRQIGERVQACPQAQTGAWTVRQVDLMQSQLSPSGPTYTVLATINF